MEAERERGWLKRALNRATQEVESRPIWRKPEEMRRSEIQKNVVKKSEDAKRSDDR
jgi:hypothetical protein